MNLKSLSDDQLLASLDNEFANERKASHNILLHLKEVAVRHLDKERGYPDLFTMLMRHFRQSESAANQRVKALQLILAVPAVEDRLVSGELSLSSVAMAQRQIRSEERLTGKKLSKDKKVEIVDSITNKTLEQAKIELFKLLPETAAQPQQYERRVSENATRVGLTVPDDVMEMMKRLKEVWAHVDPAMDNVEVMRRAFKIALEKVDPAQTKPKAAQTNQTQSIAESARQCDTKGSVAEREKAAGTSMSSVKLKRANVKRVRAKRLTYYGKEFDRELWARAGSRCEYIDKQTGRRCECRFGLQRDHIVPLAMGGANAMENMQLVCGPHNRHRARQAYGRQEIDGLVRRNQMSQDRKRGS